ncbi:putative 2-dehydropantoate 2-reductase [Vibrio nigripulchritudo SOn1]|uniref:2-dehydropantoate 2-reductase n=1 Tax=Vibrio nigripulchritudo SOn1 TaxID=1238450 RepID=A0AAV2VV94_9VIBR|nr:2-dehydropantoate 2-reductase [Vibrio nigripulchritudo]CCO48319.1 putative 2-dehydropantoate 2-reductase [Vibrio nigripulchritudo SOn1]
MNITILGPGAVGALWATSLHDAGHNVSLWSRSCTASTLHLAKDKQAPIEFRSNDDNGLANADLILITVKAWQVEEAIAPILPKLSTDTILLFMHNGMGAVDAISERIKDFPVVLGTTTQAAYKPSANQVQHTGHGMTQLGGVNTKGCHCDFLAEVLNHAMPEVSWNPDIQQALWDKLAINCAINPLTAIEQCLNGDLAQEKYHSTLDAIVKEVARVMKAEQQEANYSDLRNKVDLVINATAKNHSSMQQDVFYQRKTEIEFITGYVVSKARLHGIPTPVNQSLLDEIQRIEQSWSSS